MSDHPCVTFAIIAFNQAHLINEAIDGAFAQDYPNLEIVLSDDGSADGTFEIMQRRAAAYQGSHRVRALQTERNAGLVHHVRSAARQSVGELVVLAAGDDISLPHRVSTLVSHWLDSRPDALFSGFKTIEEDGSRAENAAVVQLRRPQTYFPASEVWPILGVSSAYDRRVFDGIDEPGFPVFAEDYFYFLMLGMRGGRTVVVDQPLVLYRRHRNALTHRAGNSISLERFEEGSQRVAAVAADLLDYLDDCVTNNRGFQPNFGCAVPVALMEVRSDLAFCRWQATWMTATPLACLRATVRLFKMRRARWLLPRALGFSGLVTLKRVCRLATGG